MRSLLLFFFLLGATAASAQTTNLSVQVTNASSEEGKIIFSLFNEETFMVAPPLTSKTSEIKNGLASVTFEDITPGEYGIIVIHDKNENGTIDFNQQGIPVEEYGTSNNPMNFGPPQWNDAKFSVGQEPLDLEIRF